jgi:hypothetical protein
MGITAAMLGFMKHGPADGNVFAGFMVAYFVGRLSRPFAPCRHGRVVSMSLRWRSPCPGLAACGRGALAWSLRKSIGSE